MSDPIVQIIQTHPVFENMQARFEVEIGQVRQELQKMERDRDEWQEKGEAAYELADKERDFLRELIRTTNPETNREEYKTITLTELTKAISNRREHRWNGDFGVLDNLIEVLEHTKAETETVRTEYVKEIREVKVEVLPKALVIDGEHYRRTT